jgi:5'-nucleotidase
VIPGLHTQLRAKFTHLRRPGADIVPRRTREVNIFGDISLAGIIVFVRIEESSVDSNLTVANARAESVELSRNNVLGDVLVRNNKTRQNVITGNSIAGDLVCSLNTPAPVDQGKPNTVDGNKVGQCARL